MSKERSDADFCVFRLRLYAEIIGWIVIVMCGVVGVVTILGKLVLR